MNNNPNKKNLKKSVNPFLDDFSTSYEDISDPLAHTLQNINIDKYHKDVLGNEPLDNETALESKLKQQLKDKDMKERGSLQFLSGKNLNTFRESLKNLNVFEESKEYITLRKMPKISQIDYENLKQRIVDNNILGKLFDQLENVNCNFKSLGCEESVGGITPLTYLVESKFSMSKQKAEEIIHKYNILKNYIYNYRTINGDGNCFYRAVMFRYLEILILNEKTEVLKNVIFDIVNSFNSEELKQRTIIRGMDIKPDLTFKILMLIVDLLEKNMKEKALEFLVKSFSTCKKFDYAVIFYLRYILYDYIKKNENKVYLEPFPIKIGNLLPSKYETEDGKFLFNSFYENYLLNFFTDAEKIIIYLTPMVLGIELDVIVYDSEEEDICQKFKWEGDSELKIDDVISLINSKNHYEIIYNLKDHDKYHILFKNYENNTKSVVISDILEQEKEKDLGDSNNFNILEHSYKEIKKDIKKPDSDKKKYDEKNVNNIDTIQDNNQDNKQDNNQHNNQNNFYNKNNKGIKANNYLGKNNDNQKRKEVKVNNYSGNNDNNINNNIQIKDKIQTSNKDQVNINTNNNNIRQKNFKNNNNININPRRSKYNTNQSNNISNENTSNNNYNKNKDYNTNQPRSGKSNYNAVQSGDSYRRKYLDKKRVNDDSNQSNPRQVNQINQNEIKNYNTNEPKPNTVANFNQKYEKRNIPNMQIKNNPLNNKMDIKSKQIIINNNTNKIGISNQNQKKDIKTFKENISKPNNTSNKNDPIVMEIGLPTPGQNIKENKNRNICMNCKKEITDNTNINICKYCFKSKMIDELYSNYIEYIQIDPKQYDFNGKIEIKLKNDAKPQNLSLIQAIKEYNKNYRNENLTYQKVLDELKKKVCAICCEDINSDSFKLPCNCHFCSKEHLVSYINNINFSYTNIQCYTCNEQYTEDMMFYLGVLCCDYNISLRLSIIRFFNNQLNNNCCVCGRTCITKKITKNLKSSQNKSQKNFDEFLSKLNHNFCEKCNNSINSRIKCKICNIEHYIYQGH